MLVSLMGLDFLSPVGQFFDDPLASLGVIAGLNSIRPTVPTTHTRFTKACRKYTSSVNPLPLISEYLYYRHCSGTSEPPHKPSSNNDSLRSHYER
ncbi:hypothetical protein AVEN_267730-1 [Araneus ventricosus]|uniref:Uncharacterized protein n=1 Tax=Araneus ventricosus TaxID=182803 RepID=A0A4Y2CWL6_ARAVE|nr:hypothetical protein AVEN_267730-1 [Araneus ventricosus]